MTDASRAPLRPGLPFLGNALQANADACRFFLRGYEACGPVFRVSYPGRDLVILAGRAANELFARRGELFDAGATYRRVTRELGTSTIPNAVDGAAHGELRALLAPSLSAQALEPAVPGLLRRVEEAARSWPVGTRLRVRRAVEPLVADLVGATLASRPLPDGMHADMRLYGTLMGAVAVGGAGPEWLLYLPPVRAARRRMQDFVETALREHRAAGPGLHRDPDVLDALVRLGGRDPARFSEQVQAALGLLPLKNAGIYLYRLVSFALFELCADPELYAKVAAEVDAAFESGPPDLDAVRRARTLSWVVHEVLRLYPMAIALPRVVAEPFEFEGWSFGAGSTVYFAGPVTHFLPEVFPEPDRFDPERFSPTRSEHRRPWVFAPFGLGQHACMTRAWSVAMASVVIAGLLRSVELALDPADFTLKLRVVPNPIPEAVFRFRVAAHRTPTRAREAAPSLEDDLSSALAGLPAHEQAAVFADLASVELPADTVVFRQGDLPDRFYLIRRGEVEVVVESADGARVVATLGPGAHFGEIGMLQDVPRTATVRTTAAVTLLALGRAAFNRLAVDGELTRRQLVQLLDRRRVLTELAAVLPTADLGEIATLGQGAERLVLTRGEVVVRQGEPAERFFVLVEGQVEVILTPPGSEGFVVAELVAPDHFGEIGLLQARPRTATVRVSSDAATLLTWDREAFETLAKDPPPSARGVAEVAAARLLELTRR